MASPACRKNPSGFLPEGDSHPHLFFCLKSYNMFSSSGENMTHNQTLYNMLDENEEILWSGKPNLKCFILESIFNPLLPFAVIWALFDGFFISMLFHKGGPATQTPFLPIVFIGFFALHLMPVWLYLGGVIFSFLKHKHTEFVVTNKGVYVSGGIFTLTYEHKSFAELSQVTINRGVIDQLLGVGDVFFPTQQDDTSFSNRRNYRPSGITICDIPDYQEVYNLVKEELKQQH